MSGTLRRLDSGTRVFWLLIAVLLGASAYFGAGIAEQRGTAREAGSAHRALQKGHETSASDDGH